MSHALRTLLGILAGEAPSSCPDFADSGTSSHALLGVGNRSWRVAAAFLAAHKTFWLAIPVAALEPRTLDLRPHVREMAAALFGEGEASEADLRVLRVILKRMRQYAIHGRRLARRELRSFVALLRLQNRRCATCGYGFTDADLAAHEFVDEPNSSEQLAGLRIPHVDHIVPFFLAGDAHDNLQLLCTACNVAKGTSIAWPVHSGVIGARKPSDLGMQSAAQRWAVLARDGKCTTCARTPLSLCGDEELLVVRTNTTRGWLIENLQARCSSCEGHAGRRAAC